MNGIYWLASYPRSGSTWLRIFLANLRSNNKQPARINQDLAFAPMASLRKIFDDGVGVEASELTQREIASLRPKVYTHIAQHSNEHVFLKIHDARTNIAGVDLAPPQATAGIVYILRNPLDVAVSYARYSGISIDRTIANMGNPHFAVCKSTGKMSEQLQQDILSWSQHVTSWVDGTDSPVHIVRFEDMKQYPESTFTKIARFIGFTTSPRAIQTAIESSSFQQLKRQEQNEGFKEKENATVHFFRRGLVGSWRDELCKDQVSRIVDNHGELMQRFGYLDMNDPIL